ncbi:hypothetical protein F5888DRAFT_1634126 [Russula emetica]|nr:hypothetical protein F5888DRAFT_1634126 [Russula emetica]
MPVILQTRAIPLYYKSSGSSWMVFTCGFANISNSHGIPRDKNLPSSTGSWEFVTTLDYEWSVFRGHRSYGWTIWIYEIARISTFTSVVTDLVFLSLTVWVILIWVPLMKVCFVPPGCLVPIPRRFPYVAVWEKKKVALAIASGLWLVNLGFLISCESFLLLLSPGIPIDVVLCQVRAIWNPVARNCLVTNVETAQPSLISLFVTDLLLVLIMLAGLLRLRRGSGGARLWRLLWRQGLIWLFIATVTEFLQVITLVIAATRLYRALVNLSSPLDSYDISAVQSFLVLTTGRVEVIVHKAYEVHAMTPCPSSDGHSHDNNPHEITFDDNMKDRAEK